MANRGLTISIPIWGRVSAIIALVLVGVVVSSMLVRASSGMDYQRGPDHGSQMEGMQGMQGMDHSGGPTRSAAPSASEPAENPAPPSDQTPPKEGGPSHVRPNH